jgi:hypothetical protein
LVVLGAGGGFFYYYFAGVVDHIIGRRGESASATPALLMTSTLKLLSRSWIKDVSQGILLNLANPIIKEASIDNPDFSRVSICFLVNAVI